MERMLFECSKQTVHTHTHTQKERESSLKCHLECSKHVFFSVAFDTFGHIEMMWWCFPFPP